MDIKKWIHRLLDKPAQHSGGSYLIKDEKLIKDFISNPKNTMLVSFPRTGSHWLRMVMELYFGRPSLVRVFYYPKRSDYLTLHKHDVDLDFMHQNVIYLYRDPVETVFSLISYHKENIDDDERILHWSDLYGQHLNKWLHQEKFTGKKTIIRYEHLRDTPDAEFTRICEHFGEQLDSERLHEAMSNVTKGRVKAKTEADDPNVISLGNDYESQRSAFRQNHANRVWEVLLEKREYLKKDFE